MKKCLFLAALLLSAPASAQISVDTSGNVRPIPLCTVQADNTCLLIRTTESFRLITANTPSAPATVFGGDYILSQTCSGYGTLNLQVLGPDGVTYQTILSKTASDTAGGTGMSLGSYAKVQITVTGTTGCNAILARVPA